MDTLINFMLIIHIVSGYTAFVAAPIALLVTKGGNRHKIFGKTFYYAMLSVCMSALFISFARSNTFLFHIAIFTFYMNHSGRRSIQDKSLKPSGPDLFLLLICIINCILMLLSHHLVLMVFGGICSFLAGSDVILYIKIQKKKHIAKTAWLQRHIGHMIGTYIAATTAFLVVNVHSEIQWLPWLIPSFIGAPLIFYFTNSYRRKAV